MEVFTIIGIVLCVALAELLVFGLFQLIDKETEGVAPLIILNAFAIILLLVDRWMI